MVPGAWNSDAAASAYSYSHPAYTPVQVRQSFAPAIPAYNGYTSPITAPAPEQTGPQEWPEGVRTYVQRTFYVDNNDPSIPKSEIEARLKTIIATARSSGQLYTTNWDMMPLPQQLIRDERNAMNQAAQVPPSYTPPSYSAYVHPPPPAASPLASNKRKISTDEAARWRSPAAESNKTLKSRITKPEKRANAEKRSSGDENSSKSSKLQKQLEREKRARRFQMGSAIARSPTPPPSDGPVVGTCQDLEKRYLRLTAPPIPSKVRPEPVLWKTLELLKQKWRTEANYGYICDQFKSLRQDLTVQRIKNEFTVSVYEIHARIALEKGDLGEYNQCQTQLKSLYASGIKGNPVEFQAYRILYFIHTANRTGLNETIAALTPQDKLTTPIKHALDVRSALALGNYHKFFQLYLDTPGMGGYLMDMFVGRERLAALCMICKAYKPSAKIRFITEELGFESDAEACQFIIDHNGQHLLDDSSKTDIFFLTGKAGKLFLDAKNAAFRSVDIKGQI
ncbi:THP3 -like protein C2A9.11c [Ceratocystis lukuohia]|uniref:THP3 -like protein C2A9.11c n=1 Tax=Ceratocystis lukuohia TaxID=2019550 RepID=A0ABR4MQ74_9PEZI